jgi:hypothetical protein
MKPVREFQMAGMTIGMLAFIWRFAEWQTVLENACVCMVLCQNARFKMRMVDQTKYRPNRMVAALVIDCSLLALAQPQNFESLRHPAYR